MKRVGKADAFRNQYPPVHSKTELCKLEPVRVKSTLVYFPVCIQSLSHAAWAEVVFQWDMKLREFEPEVGESTLVHLAG